jgi:hypothetical protein
MVYSQSLLAFAALAAGSVVPEAFLHKRQSVRFMSTFEDTAC